ncbi:MAG: glycosyltransferase [Dysgonamonadaceae bacterium]|jgi:glycosyltransferase involved in cell wall biosynthesis|nr:glycosyltransferase [Dysgonamonadaceae bacterium]
MIGLFNDSYLPILDGVALTVQNYAHCLHKKQQQVCIITAKSPNYVDETPYPVFRYTSLPVLMRKPYRYGVPSIDWKFRKKLKQIPFTLIHAHSPFSSAQVALDIANEQKIPLVATFHSKYQDDFESAVRNKRLARWMIKKIMALYERADEVWIPQAAVEETIRLYGYKGKLVVVDNGCDFVSDAQNITALKQQARSNLHIASGMPVFLFVGQHILEKNTRLIIEALAAMKEKTFQMFFIGTGYAEKYLKTLTADYNLSQKVTFLGMISDREMLKQYYAAADLFLFPSLYDNAPLVVREASALHTPSILVKNSTAAEVITDNYNGFLIDNSSEALTERISTLIQSPEIIKQVGAHASQTIARSWENVTDEVLHRYVQLRKRYTSCL